MTNLQEQKQKLLKKLKLFGYLKSPEVEKAFLAVPREEFVLPRYRNNAYDDTPLPMLAGQTISAPHMHVIMCEKDVADLKPGQKILEIGTGSGYNAALIAEIVAPKNSKVKGHVYTIEIVRELYEHSRKILEKLGYLDRITVILGDGSIGYPLESPYDRIIVTAAAPSIIVDYIKQLVVGGRLIIPVGRGFYQDLLIVTKLDEKNNYISRSWGGVAFVPLRGKKGYNNFF